MSENELERIIRSIDEKNVPPQGLKEKMLEKILKQQNMENSPETSEIEGLIFRKPLWAACAISIVISGILWVVMGNGYTGILFNLIGIR